MFILNYEFCFLVFKPLFLNLEQFIIGAVILNLGFYLTQNSQIVFKQRVYYGLIYNKSGVRFAIISKN